MSSVEELLQMWGFGKYVDVFNENEVDLTSLELLDDAQIRTLIPAIGPQAKFKKKLSDWKELLGVLQPEKPNKADTRNSTPNYKYPDSGLSVGDSTPSRAPSSPASTLSGPCLSHSSTDPQDLISLLEKSPDGRALIKQRDKPLGEQFRKILTKEIAQHIIRDDPKEPVTAKIYMHWIDEIERVFPQENSSIYYTATHTGVRRPQGRLFDAITNLKAKYRRNKVFEPRARSLDQTVNTSTGTSYKQKPLLNKDDLISNTENHRQEPSTQEVEECIEWLQSSVDNYALCLEKWTQTNEHRLQRVLSESEGHQTYIQSFPCLRRSWGHTLLTADFDRWYPGNEQVFEEKFPLLKAKLLSVSDKISRKSTFVADLKKLARDADPQISTLASLMLIPYILGPQHIIKKKCSAAEVCECFILRIEEDKKINEECRKRNEKNKNLGITVQPYIIVVGPLDKITARYVILDDIAYEVPSISKAVDTCFKIYWALYLEYPPECRAVWQFLQRAIYVIPSKAVDKREKVSSSVLSLLSDCGIRT